MNFDEEYDVVVVGLGLEGGIAAITAADAGARVLLLEKSEVPGGCAGTHACPRRGTRYNLMLAALMTLEYLSSSTFMSFVSSAGVVVTGSAPLRSKGSFISGDFAIATSSP